MIKNILILICLITASTTLSKHSFALEELNYGKKISYSLSYKIDTFLNGEYGNSISDYNISSIDLNNDGIDEQVLKQKQCHLSKGKCTYLVIAEKKQEILILFKIKAYNLAIGNIGSNGVKNVLALTNNVNDYNFDIYMWSPTRKMYILKAD